jgi:hypothetical protein
MNFVSEDIHPLSDEGGNTSGDAFEVGEQPETRAAVCTDHDDVAN